MILLTTFVYVVTGFLGFLLLAEYIGLSERWVDSRRRDYPSSAEFLVIMAGGAALACIYIGLVVQVFDWAGWTGV